MRQNIQLVFNSLTAQLIIILIPLSIDSILYNIMNTLGIENDLNKGIYNSGCKFFVCFLNYISTDCLMSVKFPPHKLKQSFYWIYVWTSRWYG